jgi:tetratricopeptide (TPR) repeat protein
MIEPRLFAVALFGACAVPQAPQDSPKSQAFTGIELTADEKADPIAVARQRIEQRETPGSLERAIAILQWRSEHGPETAEVHALLAEAHSRMVETFSLKKTEDRARHQAHRESGLKEARDTIGLASDQAVGHYWLGCLFLQMADAEQSYSRLKEGLKAFLRAQELSPKIDDGGPARMLGRIYQETPGWPFLGSKREAIKWYLKSLEAAPDAPLTHLWLGQTYVQNDQNDLARAELEKVTGAKPRRGHEKEAQESRQEAEELLKKIPRK